MLQRVKRMSADKVVAFAGTLTVITFIAWVGMLVFLWLLFRALNIRFNLWAAMEALSTAAAVAQIVGGGVVALVQLSESVDSHNLGIYTDVFERLMSEENIAARRWVYQHLPDDPERGIASLTPEGQAHVKRVLNSLDHLGFLVRQDWVTDDAVLQWVSPFVIKVWAKLGPYVEYEAKRRKDPDYYISVKELADRCIAWRKKNRLGSQEIVWLRDAL